MTTVIKAASARDFLGLVPALAGYTPTESVCIIPFEGSRSIGLMRFDLPTPGADLAAIADTMTGLALRLPTAERVAVVVYTEAAHDTTFGILQNIHDVADKLGLGVTDLLYVAGDGYGSLKELLTVELWPWVVHSIDDGDQRFATEAECWAGYRRSFAPRSFLCPPRPLEELTLPDEAAALAPIVGNQASATALPEVADYFAAATLQQVGNAADLLDEEGPEDRLIGMGSRLATGTLDATDTAVLHWVLERPALRDITLGVVTRGEVHGIECLMAQLAWENGVEYPAHLAEVMWGAGPRPDSKRLEQALENIRVLLAIIPQPGAFSAAAWLSWALGRSTHAVEYTKQGLAQDPGHGLCEIVTTMVDAGHLPDWAFRR